MDNKNGLSCQMGCWLLAAGAGFLTFILLLVLGTAGVIGSVFLGGVVFVVLGALLSWLFCRPLPQMGEATPGADRDSGKPATQAAAAGSAPAADAAATARASGDAAPAASATADAEAGAAVKPSKPLAGQEDLASRKGSWKYEGAASPDPGAAGASVASAQPQAAADAAATTGTRPEGLSAPRDGGADDLKKIKGVGPKLEDLCHELGFYHFDQIAGWGPDEVAWVDENLKGFKGRVTRDNWVEQAKTLAAGGETEFSQKVDKGDVY